MAGGNPNIESKIGSEERLLEFRKMGFEIKSRYGIDDLLVIMKILRSENGCPWDKVQTHESIRTDLIEETYEVCEGIDCNSPEMLREELGDLLMQVVFHAEIENEAGTFDFNDVCNDICQKLVYRHPHVFGNVKAETEDEALKSWDASKKAGKNQKTFSETLESVPKTLPALLRGEKVCKRAQRAGLPIDDASDCIERIKMCLSKLSEDKDDVAHNQQILGQLLLNLCNLNRIYSTDSEKVLTYSTNKFITDFRTFEMEALQSKGSLDKLSNEEWHEAAENLFAIADDIE